MKVIVIGCAHAGTSAVLGTAALHEDARITVYERSGNIAFLSCGIALNIAGIAKDLRSMFYSTPEALEKLGAVVKIRHDVTAVDFGARMIKTGNMANGEITYDTYDKLIIAAGSWPVMPKIENSGLKNILVCKNYDHAKEIASKAESAKKAAVIGAGPVGVELAEAFQARGMEVILIDQEKHILPRHFDAPFAQEAMKLLTRKGVHLVMGERVGSFKGDLNGRVSAVATDWGDHETSLAVLCAGSRPDTGLFKGKLDMLENGAIKADEYMRASVPDVFVAGDAAAVWNNALKAHDYVPLAANAVRMGMIAARNLKSNTTKYPGTQSTSAVRICGLNLASTGLTEESAARAGMGALAVSFADGHRPEFMPHEEVAVRLVYEGGSRRLLGGQIMSKADVALAINTLSVCIQKGMTIDELAFADFFFHPYFSKPQDFLNSAACLVLPPL
jgi:NADPH-dependent 2,4-dienoyl-CoA reductase/sulfur reductase-like enzyme